MVLEIKSVSHQAQLLPALQNIFPNNKIYSNTRKDSTVKDLNGQFLEFDFSIPQLNLYFEFQDSHHYVTTWYYQNPLSSITQRDTYKSEAIRKNKGTVISVPCWWNSSIESLVSSIYFERPDLMSPNCDNKKMDYLISLNPLPQFFKVGKVPDVGELMLAAIADINFSSSISHQNSWWMGEKYDGLRCCWNAIQQVFYSRNGREIVLPSEFNRSIPPLFIDAEIWFGRGQFLNVRQLSDSESDVDCQTLRMVAFDEVPVLNGDSTPFEKRYESILSNISWDNPFVINAARVLCVKESQVKFFTQNIIEDGGEGVILRKPQSSYSSGRSTDLVKIKAAQDEKEALVVGFESDFVLLNLPNGKSFKVANSDVILATRPKKGDVVSFSSETQSRRAIPVNPKILRIRHDLEWDDVISTFEDDENSEAITRQPHGFWNAHQGTNLRMFLEDFARKRKLDPHDPSTWYSISWKNIAESQGGRSVINHFKGGYATALMQIFPEINLKEENFINFYGRSADSLGQHWDDINKRREWLDEKMEKEGYDPLVPEHWYNSANKLKQDKRVQAILQHYSGNLPAAIIHLYPELQLHPRKFYSDEEWKKHLQEKKYFENIAQKKYFDPLVPENWYSFTIADLKDGANILQEYNGDIAKALINSFPSIGLDKSKFSSTSKPPLFKRRDRKQVLENFANFHGYNPHIAESWYNLYKNKVESKEVQYVMQYYKGSFSKTIDDLFPELNIEKYKLSRPPRDHWRDKTNARNFFIEYSKFNNFDPFVASNWYDVNPSLIKGSDGILSNYEGNFINALVDLFPDVEFNTTNFNSLPREYWAERKNKRNFFETFAKENNFDPLIPSNWYNIQINQLSKSKGCWSVIGQYNNSISKALIHLFPEIGLQLSSFAIVPKHFWESKENRRKILEEYVTQLGKDPLMASTWSTTPSTPPHTVKKVLKFYNGNLLIAAKDLFQGLKFQ